MGSNESTYVINTGTSLGFCTSSANETKEYDVSSYKYFRCGNAWIRYCTKYKILLKSALPRVNNGIGACIIGAAAIAGHQLAGADGYIPSTLRTGARSISPITILQGARNESSYRDNNGIGQGGIARASS